MPEVEEKSVSSNYTAGDMRAGRRAVGKEIDKFTIGRPGEMYSLFRVIGGTLIVLETASQCAVTVQMEYAGYKDPRYSFGNAGWLAFRSNGFLEAVILKNLGEPLAEAAK